MPKFFNTAGLCFPEDHYMVDPLKRLTDVEGLIEKKLYFTLHAPRQTGKTTFLYALARKLNASGNYIALVASFESAGYQSISVQEANKVFLESINEAAINQLNPQERPPQNDNRNATSLKKHLADWCRKAPKPVVLLIDEIDALFDDVLISVLRQLRDGYQSRPEGFPSSVALVGLRDIRDYKVKLRLDRESLGTASPFNVKAESVFLNNFTPAEVFELLEQHTTETGQQFPSEVKQEIFNLSQGQPWLVNAIANQMIAKILNNDYSRKITLEIVNKAKIQLIQRRDTHLDSLVDKLKEDRVKKVIQSIINGERIKFDIFDDDIAYVRDLGLVSQSDPLRFANPIYAEIVPRIMAYPIQVSFSEEIQTPWFLNDDGALNMEKVIKEFQKFYRRHSEAWLDRYAYKESAQHLLFMAFLQRIINAGGEIIREMALGNERVDMLVKYKQQEFAFELKIRWRDYTIEDGKEQLHRYLDKVGLDEGYLVIYETRDKSWDEKIYWKEIEYKNKKIIMVGL
ncbi:AAA-like domain-containing protein [candidate division KSB1 bacterium]|nr:AAA-like domain-containing protein [candidate division KSB1 bacterium]